MDKDEFVLLFIFLGIILIFAILNGFVMDYEKTECLKEDGKWLSGGKMWVGRTRLDETTYDEVEE